MLIEKKLRLFVAAIVLCLPFQAVAEGIKITVLASGLVEARNDKFNIEIISTTGWFSALEAALRGAREKIVLTKFKLKEFGLVENESFVFEEARAVQDGKKDPGQAEAYNGEFGLRISFETSHPKKEEILKYVEQYFDDVNALSSLTSSAKRAAEQRARSDVAVVAKEKAEAYAKGLSCTLGRVVSLEEGAFEPYAGIQNQDSVIRLPVRIERNRVTLVGITAKVTYECNQ